MEDKIIKKDLHNLHSIAKYYKRERMKEDDMDRSCRTRVVI